MKTKIKNNTFMLIACAVFFSGAALPFAYAPYNQFWLALPLLAILFFAVTRASPRQAGWLGWWFGLGWFFHGIHWIYYSLHYHGGTPLWLVLIMLFLLSAYLALFPALAMYLARRLFKVPALALLIAILPAMWALSEWLRGWLFTGFPWLQIGYAFIDSPLAGYAPLFGGLGVSYVAAISAALLLLLIMGAPRRMAAVSLIALWLSGFLLSQIDWTHTQGNPIKVSLIQGNIPQRAKWEYDMHDYTLDVYRRLTEQNWDSDLIVWPETAVPDFDYRVPGYLAYLKQRAMQENTDVLLGIFTGNIEDRRYYNSVISLRDGVYQKRHLVPLGEYYPFRSALEFFRRWIRIPMSDIAAAQGDQPLVTANNIPLGINICFEDAFDRDVVRDVPQAQLLVNVSNDAWFEDSIQPWQHHQLARMRALETGRYMLRSTNTGVSSVIDYKGRVVAQSPQFVTHVLTTAAQPMSGSTPYVRWHNYALMISLLVLLMFVWRKSARK
jgi:apolipoprotein N-acyltransferase